MSRGAGGGQSESEGKEGEKVRVKKRSFREGTVGPRLSSLGSPQVSSGPPGAPLGAPLSALAPYVSPLLPGPHVSFSAVPCPLLSLPALSGPELKIECPLQPFKCVSVFYT